MPSYTLRHPLVLTLLTSTLLLAACHDEHGADDAIVAARSAADKPVSGPRVNYWSTIAPLIAGNYASLCARQSDAKAYQDAIVIGNDGKVTAAGFAEDLLKANSVGLSRSTDNGVPTSAMMADSAAAHITLVDKGSDRGISAAMSKGKDTVMCEKSNTPTGMRGKKLYQALAGALASPPQTISCIASGAIKQEQVGYELANGVVTVNGERFDLAGAEQESALFTDGLGSLTYMAAMPAKRTLHLTFDVHGKLKKVEGNGRNDQLYACEKKP